MTTPLNLPAIQAQLITTILAKQAYWDALRELERLTGDTNGNWTDEQSDRAHNNINLLATAGDDNRITELETRFFLHRIGVDNDT